MCVLTCVYVYIILYKCIYRHVCLNTHICIKYMVLYKYMYILFKICYIYGEKVINTEDSVYVDIKSVDIDINTA